MNELETKTLPDGSRIERVRELVDEILLNMSDPTEGRCAYLHLYGVAQACALLALKREEMLSWLLSQVCYTIFIPTQLWTHRIMHTRAHRWRTSY